MLVLRFDILEPEFRNRQNQLWHCIGGFGANPKDLGRPVYVTNPFDGEQTSFSRQDFAGIVKPEVLQETYELYKEEETMDIEPD